MRTLLATVLRGLRSRALLSGGSVLLLALAIGSAVLGPVFSAAVTSSYLVTRLDEAPNRLTGLSWVYQPGAAAPSVARGIAAQVTAAYDGPFATPQTTLLTEQSPTPAGVWRLTAALEACEHLEVTGACPEQPGEVLMLAGDAEFTSTEIGETLDLGALGEHRVVGTYRVPDVSEEDFWFDLTRFASIPPAERRAGNIPYQPAPLVTVEDAFAALEVAAVGWSVLVDRRLEVPPDLSLADTEQAERTAAGLDGPPREVGEGTLTGRSISDLGTILDETREQQQTARASVTPAVVSLVLVALALLLRLLTAAAELRLPELALASLRGLGRRRMWSLGLSEPLVLLVAAVPLGGALGIAAALALVRAWLVPGLPLPLPWEALAAGGLVALASVGVAVASVGLVLRTTLAEQLAGVRRPKRTGRVAVVAQLVLVAAAVMVLLSTLSAAPGDPDVTDLVLPVLLAVVAGLAATRATAWLAGRWTRRRTRSLPGFVAARALSRRTEGTLVVLPVTAALAICVFGAGVHDSAAEWRASVAATRAPADVVWRSSLPLDQTVDLTHRIDPEGRWLMAAGTLVTQGPTYAVVDAPRLDRVAAWPDQWTPGTSAAEVARRIEPQGTPPQLAGTSVRLTATVDGTTERDLSVRLRLDGTGGDRPRYAFLGPFPAGRTTTVTEPVPFCRDGCELDAITLGGAAALPVAMDAVVTLEDLRVDDEPVTDAFVGAGWVRSPTATAEAAVGAVEATSGSGSGSGSLAVSVDSEGTPVIAQLVAGALPAALPVVAGLDAVTSAQGGSSSMTSALTFPVDPVVEAGSVPLLGPIGLMVDHGMLTLDREVYEQDAPVYVLARGDTPAAVQDALRDRGASVETTLEDVRRTLDQGAYALALRLYAVVAALVLLMALAGLVVSTAVQLPSRRRDAASLRVVGVPRRSVAAAVVLELAVVLGSTAVAGLAAGSLAQYVVLRTVTLGTVDTVTTPALVASIDPARLVLLALLAAVLLGTVALVSAVLTVRGARGSTLRETAR
ncbi:FtsX-like permease family protein [Nocardioides sp. zg-579]|uniref:FtsX-like permease family protein n=1 Tax=Nocardioides marmotae TaxID=2663857 RepID=A0A6I3JE62_9ACTN|nr:FtsX-like permease family protein [Nocardioides marmotae]MCR6032686.1 FtsX-like permease family protein [Gordonia jinghuaiqii]MTB96335.1 FtsX-like permease family protein [Nocardioides marmotae]QKE03181.1 FtsX-like permease family protein [Nocardioides marmotae]